MIEFELKKNARSSPIRASFARIGLCALILSFAGCGTSTSGGGGGISGGGGNAEAPVPAGAADIVRAGYQSRILVQSWLNVQEKRYLDHKISGSEWDKLFAATPNVFDVLDGVKIEFRANAPCIDPNHGELRDGSAELSLPNQICISTQTLAKKLTTDNYAAETGALILHEISHLLRTDEAEAVRLQSSILPLLSHQSAKGFAAMVQPMFHDFMTLTIRMEKSAVAQNCLTITSFDAEQSSLSGKLEAFGEFKPFRWAMEEHLNEQILRAQALEDFTCSIASDSSDSIRETYGKIYRLGMGSDDQVAANTFAGRVIGVTLPVGANPVMIPRLKIQEDESLEALMLADDFLSYEKIVNDYVSIAFVYEEVR